MRKVVLQEFLSIDGLVTGQNDSVDFIPASTQGDLSFGREQVALMDTIDTLLLGRGTLERAPWGKWNEGRIVGGSAVEEVARLKQQSGKDMLISGSISLAQSLIAGGMVDEYRLVLCPVVLGGGRRLFRDNAGSIAMRLLKERSLDRGAVSLIYGRRDTAG